MLTWSKYPEFAEIFEQPLMKMMVDDDDDDGEPGIYDRRTLPDEVMEACQTSQPTDGDVDLAPSAGGRQVLHQAQQLTGRSPSSSPRAPASRR